MNDDLQNIHFTFDDYYTIVDVIQQRDGWYAVVHADEVGEVEGLTSLESVDGAWMLTLADFDGASVTVPLSTVTHINYT